MHVVTVGGARRAPTVEMQVSPVYDLLLSLIVAGPLAVAADQYEATATWRATVAARGGEALLAEALRQTGAAAVLDHELFGLAALAPDGPRAVPAFLDWLADLPIEEVATLLLSTRLGADDDTPTARAAVGGDRAAATRLLGGLEGEERRRAALWLADPARERADLLALLRRWYAAVFAPEEERLLAIIGRDAASKERLRAERGPEGLLRAVGGLVQFSLGPHIQRVVVAPAVLARPALLLIESAEQGLYLIIAPVADESLEPPEELAPPRALVRLYKALSDETRLKILRLLSREELYATELAERLGLAKATISHHMMLLRAAGLVEVRGERKLETYYTLHREALAEPSGQLRRYLGS